MPGGPPEAEPLPLPGVNAIAGASGGDQPCAAASQAGQQGGDTARKRALPPASGFFNCACCAAEVPATREDAAAHAAGKCGGSLYVAASPRCLCPRCGAACKLDGAVQHACFVRLQPAHPPRQQHQQQHTDAAGDEAPQQLLVERLFDPAALEFNPGLIKIRDNELRKAANKAAMRQQVAEQQQQYEQRRVARAAGEMQAAAYDRALLARALVGALPRMRSCMAQLAGPEAWRAGEAGARRRAETWVSRMAQIFRELAATHGKAEVDRRCAGALADAGLQAAAPAGLLRASGQGDSGGATLTVQRLLGDLLAAEKTASGAAAAAPKQQRARAKAAAPPAAASHEPLLALTCAWRSLIAGLAPLCSPKQLTAASGLFPAARLLELLELLRAKSAAAAGWLPVACAAFRLYQSEHLKRSLDSELYGGLRLACAGWFWWEAAALLRREGLAGLAPEAQRRELERRGMQAHAQVHLCLVDAHLNGPSRGELAAITRRRAGSGVLSGFESAQVQAGPPGWRLANSITTSMLWMKPGYRMSTLAHASQLAGRDCGRLLFGESKQQPAAMRKPSEVVERLQRIPTVNEVSSFENWMRRLETETLPREHATATAAFQMAQLAASDKNGPYGWLPHQLGAAFAASCRPQQYAVATTVACAVLDASGLLGVGAAIDTEPHGRHPSVRELAVTSVYGRGALVKRLRAPEGVESCAPEALGEEDYLDQHEGRDVTLKAFRGLQGRAPYLYVVQYGTGDLKALSIREGEVNSLDLSQLPFADHHSLMELTYEFHVGGLQEDRVLTGHHHDALCDAAAAGLMAGAAVEALRPAAHAAIDLAREVLEAATHC